MKRLGLILLFLLGLASAAQAQRVQTPSTTAVACAYNTVAPTLTSTWFGYVQCDSTGRFLIAPGSSGTPYLIDCSSISNVLCGLINSAIPAGTNDIGNVGGSKNVTPTDCSGTLTLGGTAQNAHAANAAVRGMQIQNLDTTEVLWISVTTTAAASTAQSYALSAATSTTQGGSYNTPLGFGYNTALSVVAATTGHKWSCTRW